MEEKQLKDMLHVACLQELQASLIGCGICQYDAFSLGNNEAYCLLEQSSILGVGTLLALLSGCSADFFPNEMLNSIRNHCI
jgi:hypothetical protein